MELLNETSCLAIIKISGIITVFLLIAVIVLSVLFVHDAENSYYDNQMRIAFNNNVSRVCPVVLNITYAMCNDLCTDIFERANISKIGSYCLGVLLATKNNDLRFIPKCTDLFRNTGEPYINKGPIDTYANYITGKNMQMVMLPFGFFSLIVHIMIFYGIKARMRMALRINANPDSMT